MKKLYHYAPMLILSLLAAIVLIAFELCFFVSQVIFKPELYSEAMGKNDVAEAIYEDLDTYFGQYSIPSNIPKEVFTGSLDKSELSRAAYGLLSDSLAYLTDPSAEKPEPEYDFTSLENDITGYFESYAEENKIEKNDEYRKMLDSTISTAEEQIESKLDVMMLYTVSQTKFAATVHKYAKLINAAAVACAVMLAVLAALMVFVDRHHPRDLTYWFGTAIFCSSAAQLIPAVYLDKIGYFNSFFMKSEHVYRTVTGFFQTALDKLIFMHTVLVIIAVLLIAVTLIVHMIYKWYRTRRHLKEA